MATNAFQRKKVDPSRLKSIDLACPEVESFCSSVKAATGAQCWLVGGAIRQLVRNICWKGETPENILSFLNLHLRDRDVLVDRAVDKQLIQSLWMKYLPKAETSLDVISFNMVQFSNVIDWHSNVVFYDGKCLTFLALDPGEDYINADNESELDYILLRGWINHHPLRGFSCFKNTFPAESLGSFYFPTYLKKLAELNKMYGGDNDSMFNSEIETLYNRGRIGRQTYLSYKLGKQTILYQIFNNAEAILIVGFYLLLFSAFYFFL